MGLDEMPPTLRGRFSTDGKRTQKGAKKEPKKAPLFYIYIACKGPFLDGFRDGRGTVKVDSPKRRGRAREKTTDLIILKNSCGINNLC